MNEKALFEEWLKRAYSNLERAKVGRIAKEILFEDLCFDCQQAAEKSLKALLVHLDVEFAKIHSISKLLKQIEETGITVPDEIKETAELTAYAVDARYPGDYDSVTKSEYEQALSMAKKVIKWVEEKIELMTENDNDEQI